MLTTNNNNIKVKNSKITLTNGKKCQLMSAFCTHIKSKVTVTLIGALVLAYIHYITNIQTW